MTYDPLDGYAVLFGGENFPAFLNDTWVFAHNHWTQLHPTSSPPIMYGMEFAWDAKDGYALLFGGYIVVPPSPSYLWGSQFATNITWSFVHGNWTNLTGSIGRAPSPRALSEMTYDSSDKCVLLFGGYDRFGASISDTWTFSSGSWTRQSPAGAPPARAQGSLADDPQDGYAVLFGGYSYGVGLGSTWSYHNRTWTNLGLSIHPSARGGFGFDYASAWGEDVLYGGDASGYRDTWTFKNGTWWNVTTSVLRAPDAEAGVAAAFTFDPADGYFVLSGIQWATYLGTWIVLPQSWVLGPSLLGELRVSQATSDVGEATVLNATPYTSVGNLTFAYFGLPPGCVSANISPLTCRPTQPGNFSMLDTVTEASGSSISGSVQLTVNPDPVISSFRISPNTVTLGDSVVLTVNATAGTGRLNYDYSGLPPGCGSANRPILLCRPSAVGTGYFLTYVNITDQAGYSVGARSPLVISPLPSLVRVSITPSVLDVGQSYRISATMLGGTSPFTYGYQGLPAGCATPIGPTVTCVAETPGLSPVTVNATDAFGWQANGTGWVNANPAPVISEAGATPAALDLGMPVELSVAVLWGTPPYSYHYDAEPAGCRLGNQSSSTCIPEAIGNYTVQVSVTDQSGWVVSSSFALSVSPVLSSVALIATPTEIDVGQTLTLTAYTVGGTGPLLLAYRGLPAGCGVQRAMVAIRCSPPGAGLFTVGVTAKDRSDATVTADASVFVHPRLAATLNISSPDPVWVGDEVDIQGTPMGGSGAYTFDYSGLPPGCNNANLWLLRCYPSSNGTFALRLDVSDALGANTSATSVLTVNPRPPVSPLAGYLGAAGPVLLELGVGVLSVALAIRLLLPASQRAPGRRPEMPIGAPIHPSRRVGPPEATCPFDGR